MADIVLHLPDGNLLHLPEGTTPAQMQAAARQYGDQQAAAAQGRSSFGGSLADTASKTAGAIGTAMNPLTIGTNLLHTVFHPIDTATGLASAAGNALAHPIDTVKSLSDPETGGTAIGNLALMLLAGRVPQAASAAARAMPEGLGVGAAKMARFALQPKKAALGALGDYIDGAAADAPAAAPASIGSLSAEEVATLKAQGYSDSVIQKIGNATSGQPSRPKFSPVRDRPAGFTKLGKDSSSLDSILGPEGPSKPFDWPEVGGRFEADANGSHVMQQPKSSNPAPNFEAENHSTYGNGHILPEGIIPTERLDAMAQGLEDAAGPHRAYDIDYGGVMPEFTFEGEQGKYPAPVGATEMPAANPLSKLESLKGLESGPVSASGSSAPVPAAAGQSFSDFSNSVDDIVNGAGPDDIPSSNHTGLGRSRLTNSWKDWLQKKGPLTPGWPFQEIQPE